MSYDYSALNARVVEKFGTQYNFSKALSLSDRIMSLKLNDQSPWKIVKSIKQLDC